MGCETVAKCVWMGSFFLDPFCSLVEAVFFTFGVRYGGSLGRNKSCSERAACFWSVQLGFLQGMSRSRGSFSMSMASARQVFGHIWVTLGSVSEVLRMLSGVCFALLEESFPCVCRISSFV